MSPGLFSGFGYLPSRARTIFSYYMYHIVVIKFYLFLARASAHKYFGVVMINNS